MTQSVDYRGVTASHPAARHAEARVFGGGNAGGDVPGGPQLDRYQLFRASELAAGDTLYSVLRVKFQIADHDGLRQCLQGAPEPLALLLALVYSEAQRLNVGDHVSVTHRRVGRDVDDVREAAWPLSWSDAVQLCAADHVDIDGEVALAGDVVAAVVNDPTAYLGDAAAFIAAVNDEVSRRVADGVLDGHAASRVHEIVASTSRELNAGFVGGGVVRGGAHLGTVVRARPVDGPPRQYTFRLAPTRFDVYQLLADELGGDRAEVSVTHVYPNGEAELTHDWPERYRNVDLGWSEPNVTRGDDGTHHEVAHRLLGVGPVRLGQVRLRRTRMSTQRGRPRVQLAVRRQDVNGRGMVFGAAVRMWRREVSLVYATRWPSPR